MSAKQAASALRKGFLLREPLQRGFIQCASSGQSIRTAAQATVAQPVLDKNSAEPKKAWQFPLSVPVPELANIQYAPAPKSDPFVAEITTLENGLRVASEPVFGEFCTIGVVINGGSRYEVAYPSGICHFLERLAFSSTSQYKSREELYSVLEKHGGICDAQCTKDTFIFAVSCNKTGLDECLGIIAEAVLRPSITEEEFLLTQEIVNFELDSLKNKPECDQILLDLIHAAAYRDNTLGLPKICPEENISKITREMLFSYMQTYFQPSRMVVAGVGVPHEEMVALTRKHFMEKSPVWTTDPKLLLPATPDADESTAQYTGGEVRVERDLSIFNYGPSPFPNLAHFVLGLESCGYKGKDFVAFCVLNALMGGGGSFSAGGPGKGMYTRLYLDVLNRYHWLYNCTSYHHVYADSGIFCIHASADPTKLDECAEVVVNAVTNIYRTEPSEEELVRAKSQLQSMLMMNLEQRPVMFEDLGRQVLGHGCRKSPLQYVEEIKAIESKDIKRIAEQMLSSKPSVVGFGDLKKMPAYEDIDRAIVKKDVREMQPKRGFFFR